MSDDYIRKLCMATIEDARHNYQGCAETFAHALLIALDALEQITDRGLNIDNVAYWTATEALNKINSTPERG